VDLVTHLDSPTASAKGECQGCHKAYQQRSTLQKLSRDDDHRRGAVSNLRILELRKLHKDLRGGESKAERDLGHRCGALRVD